MSTKGVINMNRGMTRKRTNKQYAKQKNEALQQQSFTTENAGGKTISEVSHKIEELNANLCCLSTKD